MDVSAMCLMLTLALSVLFHPHVALVSLSADYKARQKNKWMIST